MGLRAHINACTLDILSHEGRVCIDSCLVAQKIWAAPVSPPLLCKYCESVARNVPVGRQARQAEVRL